MTGPRTDDMIVPQRIRTAIPQNEQNRETRGTSGNFHFYFAIMDPAYGAVPLFPLALITHILTEVISL